MKSNRVRSRVFTNLGRSIQLKRTVRVITCGVCFALLLTSINPLWSTIVSAKIPVANTRAQQNRLPHRQDRRAATLTPRFGPPAANLPNLDELRRTAESSRNKLSRVEAPRPIPSTLHSRRKSNELPPGIRVPPSNSAGRRSHHANSGTSKAARVTPEALPVVPQSGRTNFALATNGSVATASSTYTGCCGFTPGAAIDGEHKGLNWLNGGGWHGGANNFPQWLQVDFNATRTIDEIGIFTGQDDYANPIEPTEATMFSLYGLTGFDVQYWTGSAWQTVSGGSVSGNNKVWKKITFSAISTTKIRLVTNASVDGWSRLPEIEAWSAPSGGGGSSSDFAMARLNPLNRTGTGGEDLLSTTSTGTCHWLA
ncbi:MAG TPA: discoidin domain-containing protein [Pyrinomonadaceae bacterium]|nr:discoidin domain-containing protein [Pyrinomonadaceae bacterium]